MSGISPAQEIADFSANFRLDDVPPPVIRRAKLHILDGLGLAANAQEFGQRTAAGDAAMGEATCAVIGDIHHVGYHATEVIAHFTSAVTSGRFLGLGAAQITSAIHGLSQSDD